MVFAPFAQDIVTRIINVNWGSLDVIVCFIGQTVYAEQFPLILEPTKDSSGKPKIEFLRSWRCSYSSSGFQPGFLASAYRAKAVGEIMTTTAPTTPDQDWGYSSEAYVFAIDGDIDQSLDRAEAGMKLLIPAHFQMTHGGEGDLPADMCPPGLLWGVATGYLYADKQMTWKMRYGEHRDDTSPDPPNTMVQCYPLGPAFDSPSGGGSVRNMSGYYIYGYRLDKKGTGTVYGRAVMVDEDPTTQNIDAAWNQSISTPAGEKGIPFQDPPPLISSDLIT
jgi:hypothetical protein